MGKSSMQSVSESYRSRAEDFDPEQIEETELPHEGGPDPVGPIDPTEPPHDPPADDDEGTGVDPEAPNPESSDTE